MFSFHVYEEVKVVGFCFGPRARSRIARITIAAMGPLLLIFRATRAGRRCFAITIAFILVKLIKLSTNNFPYTHITFFVLSLAHWKLFCCFNESFFGERLEKVAGHLFMLLFRLFSYNSAVILWWIWSEFCCFAVKIIRLNFKWKATECVVIVVEAGCIPPSSESWPNNGSILNHVFPPRSV